MGWAAEDKVFRDGTQVPCGATVRQYRLIELLLDGVDRIEAVGRAGYNTTTDGSAQTVASNTWNSDTGKRLRQHILAERNGADTSEPISDQEMLGLLSEAMRECTNKRDRGPISREIRALRKDLNERPSHSVEAARLEAILEKMMRARKTASQPEALGCCPSCGVGLEREAGQLLVQRKATGKETVYADNPAA